MSFVAKSDHHENYDGNNNSFLFENILSSVNHSQNIPLISLAKFTENKPQAHFPGASLVPAPVSGSGSRAVGGVTGRQWTAEVPSPAFIYSRWPGGINHGPNILSHIGDSLQDKKEVLLHGQLLLQRTDNIANALFAHYQFNDPDFPRARHTAEQEKIMGDILKDHDKRTAQLNSIIDGLGSSSWITREWNVRKLLNFSLEELDKRYLRIMTEVFTSAESSYRMKKDKSYNAGYPARLASGERNASWDDLKEKLSALPSLPQAEEARQTPPVSGQLAGLLR